MAEVPRPEASPGRPRRWWKTAATGALLAVLAVAGATVGAVVIGRGGLPRHATSEGDEVVDLWRWLLGIAGAITGVVLALLIVAVVQGWRDRHGPEPEQVPGSIRLELVYTAIPLVIVGWVFVLSLAASDATGGPAPADAMRVHVTGFQWGWRFEYEDGTQVLAAAPDRPELVLPVDRSVVFELESADVIHSFFAPAFLTKLDAVPGRDNELLVRTDRLGTYDGHCAEFCGLDHARMNFVVRIVPQAEFESWLAERR